MISIGIGERPGSPRGGSRTANQNSGTPIATNSTSLISWLQIGRIVGVRGGDGGRSRHEHAEPEQSTAGEQQQLQRRVGTVQETVADRGAGQRAPQPRRQAASSHRDPSAATAAANLVPRSA